MPKTYVSCAPSGVGNGPNYGMLTVDYAIYNIAKQLAPGTLYCTAPWPAFSKTSPNFKLKERVNFPENIHYELEALGDLQIGDAVLFWGDFQWGRDYQTQSTARLQNHVMPGRQLPYANLIQDRFLLRKYFLKGNEQITIHSYGTTLFQNRLYDMMDAGYEANLHWLLQNASFIKFRDPYSAQYCATIRNDFERNYLGVDAALLNTKEELLHFNTGDKNFVDAFKGQIGYYLGRSSSAFPSLKVARFLGGMCRDFNKKLVKIPWTYFTKGLFNDSMDTYLQFTFAPIIKPPTDKFLATDILKAMDACSIIVTDTYHIAVNAIALNKPVFIFPEFRSSAQRDANMGYISAWRDKRVLLFTTNSLADLLINPDLCAQKHYKKSKMEIAQLLITRPELTDKLYQGLHGLAKHDRQQIIQLFSPRQ